MNAALSNNVFAIMPRRVQKILDIVRVEKWSLVGKELRLWLIFSQELTPAPGFLETLRLKIKLHGQARVIGFALKYLQPDPEPSRYCFIFRPPTWWDRLIIKWRGEGRNIQKIILCAEEQQKEIYKEEKKLI